MIALVAVCCMLHDQFMGMRASGLHVTLQGLAQASCEERAGSCWPQLRI